MIDIQYVLGSDYQLYLFHETDIIVEDGFTVIELFLHDVIVTFAVFSDTSVNVD